VAGYDKPAAFWTSLMTTNSIEDCTKTTPNSFRQRSITRPHKK
jgi:hypothetical protein